MNIRRLILLISIGLYVVSITQECFCTESSCVLSAGCLLTGWAGLYMAGPMLTWLANPMLFISWITVKRAPYISLIFSFLAALTAVSFLYFKTIYNYNEEWTSTITYYKSGYWFWLASCWGMLLGNVIVFYKPNIIKIKIIIILIITGITVISVGLNTIKQISIGYTFSGNLDTLNDKYIITYRKYGIYMCKQYTNDRDTNTANIIIRFYHKYGNPLSSASLNQRPYPQIDSIIKYKDRVFDTTMVNHK